MTGMSAGTNAWLITGCNIALGLIHGTPSSLGWSKDCCAPSDDGDRQEDGAAILLVMTVIE